MSKTRLEAFSDGVLAIIITIMVLELKVPHGETLADLLALAPVFLSYVLSFVYVGIYWNNHHHLLHATQKVGGGVLWANLNLLFWISLTPFVTAWAGENHFAQLPVALYGVNLMFCGVAYRILVKAIIRQEGEHSLVAKAIGKDIKGNLSIALYASAIAVSFWQSWMALVIYTLVAVVWIVPDRRIEKVLD